MAFWMTSATGPGAVALMLLLVIETRKEAGLLRPLLCGPTEMN
jgi:hypothetical protein